MSLKYQKAHPPESSTHTLIKDRLLEQGFMQDTIIASHTCFGGHMDANC